MTPPQYEPSEPKTDRDLVGADAQAFIAQNKIARAPKSQSASASPVTYAGSSRLRPVYLYAAIALLVALGLMLSFVLTANRKPATGAPSPSDGVLSVPTPDNSDLKGLSKQAQQDIKTCSNAVNAVLGAC